MRLRGSTLLALGLGQQHILVVVVLIFEGRRDAPRPHGPLAVTDPTLTEGSNTNAIGAETVGHVVVQRVDRILASNDTRRQRSPGSLMKVV